MTDESMVPEWMRREKAENELAEAREEARNQRVLAAALLLEKLRPTFWTDVLRHLKIAVDALPVLGMAGSFSPVQVLQTVRIQVSKPGIFANFTYTDLFLDQDRIRCNTLDAGSYGLEFCVLSASAIGVTVIPQPKPMNPEEASEYIMRRMTELIKRRAR